MGKRNGGSVGKKSKKEVIIWGRKRKRMKGSGVDRASVVQ
jgi:hypothetical protein